MKTVHVRTLAVTASLGAWLVACSSASTTEASKGTTEGNAGSPEQGSSVPSVAVASASPSAGSTPSAGSSGEGYGPNGVEVTMIPAAVPPAAVLPAAVPPAAMPPAAMPPAAMPPVAMPPVAMSPEAPAPQAPPASPPDGAPPRESSCLGVTDPNFNLDIERPRADPPPRNAALPALFIVGDSTVKNHNIQQEGWGDLLDACFDRSRFQLINWAREGRSTRSFIEDGLWTKILNQMQPGDYVMVQFGHNDQSTLDTRGTLPGTGEESQAVVSSTTGASVDVHTYGYYLRQYAADAAAKSARLIFVTPVPRNYWTSETLMNNSVMAGYVGWMQEVAASEQLPLLDLNRAVVGLYTQLGRTAVSAFFTSGDNTHTNVLGATRSAQAVLDDVRGLTGSNLESFLAN